MVYTYELPVHTNYLINEAIKLSCNLKNYDTPCPAYTTLCIGWLNILFSLPVHLHSPKKGQPCTGIFSQINSHIPSIVQLRESYRPFKVSVTDKTVITTTSKDMNEVMKHFQNRLDRLISNNVPEHMISGLRIAMQNTLKNHGHTSNWDSARSKNWFATSSKFRRT